MRCLSSLLTVCLLTGTMLAATEPSKEPGLLFYLSGDHGFSADYAAGGNTSPNFLKDVKIITGGSKGSYLQCGNNQLLSYWAPGNIYSQRGTVSFDWRSRDPVDATEFPIFRVGYGDHCVPGHGLAARIDYNGHGFDAFVTSINLQADSCLVHDAGLSPSRINGSISLLAWDETSDGIRFYVNGKLAGEAATGMFDAALDQFGARASSLLRASRVPTLYDRGGDIGELQNLRPDAF